MKKKRFILLELFLVSFLTVFALQNNALSVPAIPNESFVEGVVSEYSVVSSNLIGIKPEQTLYRLTITIESSYGIGGTPNFLSSMTGQDIRFLSKEKLSPELFGNKIKATAIYKGDERDGMYWIRTIVIIEQEKAPQ